MTNVLVLGGSGWLSGRIAREWLSRGAAVTCLTRGGRPVPEGARLVRADRGRADAYAELGGDWDHVVDVSSHAVHVGAAVDAPGQSAAQWTFVSSISVYADDTTIDADESAPTHAAAQPGDTYDYGAEKVAAEDHVRAVGDRALIVRPGLIVGDGDPSDRFGYWAAAFARAGDGPVLVPPREGRNCQVIDVDDLAAFVVSSAAAQAQNAPGTVNAPAILNAVGQRHPLADMLAGFRDATGHSGEVIEAEEQWLDDRHVAHWAGERSLPLWLPPEMTGFMTRAQKSFLDAGGVLRPLGETIARVTADEAVRGVERERAAGLTRADERALLAALA